MAGDSTAGCLRSIQMTKPDTQLSFLLLLEGTREGTPAGGPVEGKPTGKGEVPCKGSRVGESDSDSWAARGGGGDAVGFPRRP